MSPRAAWRLETLGFGQVYEYTAGKAEWLASGLPREGREAEVAYAGDLVDRDPPTCALADTVADVRAALEGGRYGFSLVVNDRRIVLGRVRRSAIGEAADAATAEEVMEPGPSTFRYNLPAGGLAQHLAERDLKTAVITTPSGCLVGVFHRADAEVR